MEGGGKKRIADGARGKEKDRKGKEGKREKSGQMEDYKVVFWNVAGFKNKNKDFWERLNWDIMVFMETWVDKKEQEKLRNLLPRGYRWEVQWAGKKNKKGRAIGGMVMEVKRGIEIEEEKEEVDIEGLMTKRVKLRDSWQRIIGVYVNKEVEKKMGELRNWMEGKEERVIVGGDFNAKTEEEGGEIKGQKEEGEEGKKVKR